MKRLLRGGVWDRSSVLVADEKYAARYLDASTEPAFHASAVGLLRERLTSGNWYPEHAAFDEGEPVVDLDIAGLAHIPEGSPTHKLHKEQLAAHKRWAADRSEYMLWREKAEAAVEHSDGEAAWKCLEFRSDGYERVKLVDLERFEVPA